MIQIHDYLLFLQRQLGEMQRKYQQRIQERQKELDELRETVESHKVSSEQKNSCWLFETQ